MNLSKNKKKLHNKTTTNESFKIKEDSDGTKRWCINGKYHRTDGPAIEWADGSKSWYLNGKCHRTDGPAIEGADGYKAWHLNGQQVTWEAVYEATDDIDKKINILRWA